MRVHEVDDDEGHRLLRIVRRGTGSVATWRRAHTVLSSAQGMDVTKIAEVRFTSADRVRYVIHNFNADGFTSLYPKYKGGRPKTFTLPERREIKPTAERLGSPLPGHLGYRIAALHQHDRPRHRRVRNGLHETRGSSLVADDEVLVTVRPV